MKISLTPELAYLIGLWKARPSFQGLGVGGSEAAQQEFAERVLELKLAPPEKILSKENNTFFFHTALKNFFKKTVEEELNVFKKRSLKTAAFLAGWFDGCGGIEAEKKVPFFARASDEDELLLGRLNFKAIRVGSRVFIIRPKEFFEFVYPHLRILKEKAGALRSGNERDPRTHLRS